MNMVSNLLKIALLPRKVIQIFLDSVGAKKQDEALAYFQSNEFLEGYSKLVEKHFSDKEIKEIIKFYENPAINKWLNQSDHITRLIYEDVNRKIAEQFQS